MTEEPQKRKVQPPSGVIQMVLEGNKLVFQEGEWYDVTDTDELQNMMHPVKAANISLKKRKEQLLKMFSESEYELIQINKEIREAKSIFKELKAAAGITYKIEIDKNEDKTPN